MAKHKYALPRIEREETRTIDPEVAKAARQSGVPDVSLYDTSAIDYTGPSNWLALAAVVVVLGVLTGVFFIFY